MAEIDVVDLKSVGLRVNGKKLDLSDEVEASVILRFLQWKGIDSTGNLLDIGAGDGAVVNWLRDKGVKAFGVDIRNSLPSLAVNDRFVRADISMLPFEDNSFKAVSELLVFEYLDLLIRQKPLIEPILSEVDRVLEPGGYFFPYLIPGYAQSFMVRKGYEVLKTRVDATLYGFRKPSI